MGYSPWGHKELDTTERLALSLFIVEIIFQYIYISNRHIAHFKLA